MYYIYFSKVRRGNTKIVPRAFEVPAQMLADDIYRHTFGLGKPQSQCLAFSRLGVKHNALANIDQALMHPGNRTRKVTP